MDTTPEQFLGMAVVGPRGDPIGTVVDVGLSSWRQPKFLLVRTRDELVKVDLGLVLDVGAQVRISAVPRPLAI